MSKLDHLPIKDRETYSTYLAGRESGRLDAYLAIAHLCLDLCEPSGFVCLVLQQTFLRAANASGLRRRIAKDFDVCCLVDLSAVPVFELSGAYTILLVLQRRIPGAADGKIAAHIAHITESVGAALQACLEGLTTKTES